MFTEATLEIVIDLGPGTAVESIADTVILLTYAR